jgi:hypothetical protein
VAFRLKKQKTHAIERCGLELRDRRGLGPAWLDEVGMVVLPSLPKIDAVSKAMEAKAHKLQRVGTLVASAPEMCPSLDQCLFLSHANTMKLAYSH